VFAQANTGEIWGHVADANGDIVADASISVINVDTRAERKTSSNGEGLFGFGALSPGHYQVTASHEGFAAQRQDDIVLLPGQRMQIELQLHRAIMAETIAVNEYPPVLESGRTHASGFVAETEIEALPIEELRYLRLAELTPAVTRDVETGGIRVMGLPSIQNRLLIDGFDHTSSVTGDPIGAEGPQRVPYELSRGSVQALRIQTSAAPAENGRAGAAVISVATKSGANAFRGSGYEYFGDQALNGTTTLDARAGLVKPPYRSNQFGAIVGGPMLRNHDFFLLNYEGLRRTDAPAASPDVGSFAPAGPSVFNRVQSLLARTPAHLDQDLLFVRTDHDYFGQHFTLRYLDQQFAGRAFDATRFQPALVSDGPASLRTRSAAGSLASALGGAMVNEARVQYADSNDNEKPPSAPALAIWNNGSFVAQTGSSLFGPHRFATKRLQIADSLSWVTGAHSMKAGVDVLKDRNDTAFGPHITYGFQSIERLAAGGASDWVTQTLDTGTVHANVNQYAGFFQDAWRASSSLTIDLGLRYDVQDFLHAGGGTIATARNNWAPRIGLAYAPAGRNSVYRAGYGLFYGTTPALIPALAEAFNDMASRIERQMADQRELLAAVSHELRTPLARIRLAVELMKEATDAKRTADQMEREVVELDALVGELLASSRLDFGQMTPRELDGKDLAVRALERTGLPAEALAVEAADTALVGDATLLGRALANLLDNALRHGPPTVTLVGRRGDAEGTVVIEVSDTGPGIAEAMQARLFEPFSQADPSTTRRYGGTGLGLAICRQLVELMGGSIGYHGRLGEGSTFWFEVPFEVVS